LSSEDQARVFPTAGSAAAILLATDGSESAEAATRLAIELAKTTGDALLVVTVWRELRADFGIPITAIFPDVVDIERDHARDLANDVAARAVAAGVAVETIIRHGAPSREICAVAAERRPRLVVMGTFGWGRVERAVFGSVSESVLHHAPCPVLVVPYDDEQARRAEHIRRSRQD
jgi:nucleotide-binding universal stress UspA family protein